MMRLTEDEYEVIRRLLPVQRGNVRIAHRDVIDALLYVAENGCKWRALPEQFGSWHTIYTRLRRWAAAGVLDRAFQALQEHRLIRIRVEWVGLDSTSVKVPPEGTGARQQTARKPSASRAAAGPPRVIWVPRMRAWP
jgi:transposase